MFDLYILGNIEIRARASEFCSFAGFFDIYSSSVKFENVRGSEHELFLAKYFMEIGMVLERKSFSLAKAELSKSKVIEEFKEKLYSFKKGVSFAILEFHY
jgi:hypothetical protein